jgi:hypothetical protein
MLQIFFSIAIFLSLVMSNSSLASESDDEAKPMNPRRPLTSAQVFGKRDLTDTCPPDGELLELRTRNEKLQTELDQAKSYIGELTHKLDAKQLNEYQEHSALYLAKQAEIDRLQQQVISMKKHILELQKIISGSQNIGSPTPLAVNTNQEAIASSPKKANPEGVPSPKKAKTTAPRKKGR